MKRILGLILAAALLAGVGCTGPASFGRYRSTVSESSDINRLRIQEWKRVREQDDRALVPESRVVRFPSRQDWAIISSRRSKSGMLKF